MPSTIQQVLQQHIDRGRTPGLQYVAVDRHGSIAVHALGAADIRQRRAMTPQTTMMAYSMSKTITAVAVLQLVERGLVALDAPVSRYLPESPYGSSLTVRELLSHTGGVPNPIPLRWVHPAAEHDAFDEHVARAAIWRAHARLARPPGTRYGYSNIGYWMLGPIIERLTGMSFAAYVTRHVFEPLCLGPEDVGFRVPAPARHATGYLERWSPANLLGRWLLDARLLGDYDGGWRRIGDHYVNGPAFGGIVATAAAFGRFLQDQLQSHSVLLGDESRGFMFTQQRTRTGVLVPMTVGWHIGALERARVFFKEGGGGGFHCLMRLYPARGLASVIMTNATGFDVKACLDRVDPMLPQWTESDGRLASPTSSERSRSD